MNIEEIKELYRAIPFQPFDIVLTDGSTVHVGHPDFMALSPRGRTLFVYESDGFRIIDIPLIVALKVHEAA